MDYIDKIKTRVVGVDIREAKTTYAVVDIRGEIIATDYFMTMEYPDINDYVSTLSEKIIMLVEENGGYDKISVHLVPVVSQAVSRMQPTCLGRV